MYPLMTDKNRTQDPPRGKEEDVGETLLLVTPVDYITDSTLQASQHNGEIGTNQLISRRERGRRLSRQKFVEIVELVHCMLQTLTCDLRCDRQSVRMVGLLAFFVFIKTQHSTGVEVFTGWDDCTWWPVTSKCEYQSTVARTICCKVQYPLTRFSIFNFL